MVKKKTFGKSFNKTNTIKEKVLKEFHKTFWDVGEDGDYKLLGKAIEENLIDLTLQEVKEAIEKFENNFHVVVSPIPNNVTLNVVPIKTLKRWKKLKNNLGIKDG